MTRLSGRALATLLPDLGVGAQPTYSALASAITSLLLDGRVAPATRLPSERELALTLSLSRATVTSSYNALRERGLLTSRTGSGSVTVLPSQLPSTPSTRWRTPSVPDRVGGDVIDLSTAALPAPPQFDAAVRRAVDHLSSHTDGPGYGPMGLTVLRRAIAERFTSRGVPTSPDQILVTNGALHAIDLALRLLVSPGQRVLTELPTYSGLLDAVRASGARTLAVPMAPDGGWQIASMVAAIRQNAPRLAILIPDFHNPTGTLVPAEQRAEVFLTARRSGTPVLVDESFLEFGFLDPGPASAAIDPTVITVGSLSKVVWGGLRVGWVRASVQQIQRLAAVRAAMDMGQSILEQLVAVELFPELATISAQRRAVALARREFLLSELATRFPRWRTRPADGGLMQWVELDEPLATPLALRSGQYGLRIVAGSRFGVDGTMERFLRVPFALAEPELARAMDRLSSAWADLGGAGGGYSPLIVA
jgi:DNA-binding transcriptional MocR family regulator